MKRRMTVLFAALILLFAFSFSAAELDDDDWFDDDGWIEDDDWLDSDTDEEFDVFYNPGDDPGESPDSQSGGFREQGQSFNAISGYDNPDLKHEGDYAYFLSEDQTYCITSLYEGSDIDVIVPDTLGGYPVQVIGDHTFENKGFIRTVEIPESVVAIGKQAFFMCINLEMVIVPEGVVMIGDQCFAACYLLNYIQLPDSLESVGEMAFLGCYALKEIEFGSNLKSIGSCAFHTCKVLEKVIVPSEAVTIDATAFLQCPESIEIVYSNKS